MPPLAYGLQGGDDDDDLDLFGEETAEEKSVKEAREAAAKKSTKKVVGKCRVHSVCHIHIMAVSKPRGDSLEVQARLITPHSHTEARSDTGVSGGGSDIFTSVEISSE